MPVHVVPVLQRYSSKLQSIYKNIKPDPKWSPVNVYKFVDLAVITTNSDMSYIDNYSQATLRGSIDDVIKHKKPITLDELCQIPCESWVLIQGAPGIGKSMLAYEMCKRWIDKTGLQQYALVLLLRLRDESVHSKWKADTLGELVGYYLHQQSWKPQAIQEIIDCDGDGVLIILEGYDELPEEKQEYTKEVLDSFKRDFSQASVIITTRPSASQVLTDNVQFSQHIEVIGFTKASRNQYIDEFIKDEEVKESFKGYIKQFPLVSGCLHIPLNLAIVLYIFRQHSTNADKEITRLPETMTELYEALIQLLIYRHLKSCSPFEKISLTPLSDLPEPLLSDFRNLCKLAYDGLQRKQKLVFYEPESFETLGLMQKESRVLPFQGDMFAYSFLHLTIQEFLAAYHVYQNLNLHETRMHFNRYKNHLHVMMRFLAGLTGLKRIELPIPKRVKALTVFHQLQEARNTEYAVRALNNKGKIIVHRIWPAATIPQDMYVLGQCIALSSCTWRLGFSLRAMTYKHVKMLVKGIISVKEERKFILEHVGFSLNPIGNKGAVTLLSLPSFILNNICSIYFRGICIDKESMENDDFLTQICHLTKLERFLFHDNDFKVGEQLPLITELRKLRILRHVSFSQLNPEESKLLFSFKFMSTIELYHLSPPTIEAVMSCLPEAKSLKCLQIYQSEITQELALLLPLFLPSSHLELLELNNCAIESPTACIILDAVSNTPSIDTLNLNDNVIDDVGGEYIANTLGTIATKWHLQGEFLKELSLDRNMFSEKSVKMIIEARTGLPHNIKLRIRLSLQWEEYFKIHPRYNEFERYFQFGRSNNDIN